MGGWRNYLAGTVGNKDVTLLAESARELPASRYGVDWLNFSGRGHGDDGLLVPWDGRMSTSSWSNSVLAIKAAPHTDG